MTTAAPTPAPPKMGTVAGAAFAATTIEFAPLRPGLGLGRTCHDGEAES